MTKEWRLPDRFTSQMVGLTCLSSSLPPCLPVCVCVWLLLVHVLVVGYSMPSLLWLYHALQQHRQLLPPTILHPYQGMRVIHIWRGEGGIDCTCLPLPLDTLCVVMVVVELLQTPVPDGVDCKFRPLLPGWRDYCDEIDRARQRAGTLQVSHLEHSIKEVVKSVH